MPVHETDICIIGGGITSAMLAERLSELRPGVRITVVEAGKSIFDAQNRGRYRQRAIDYGEHPWPGDYIEDQQADGIISMTMAVGGLALHWGGACNRFSEEDLRLKSMYGLATDWPIEWRELEKLLLRGRAAAERQRRAEPASRRSAVRSRIRRAPIPLSYNLQTLKAWAEQSGIKFSPLPMARNLTPFGGRGGCCVYDTCGEVCPSGARYSPDYTFKQLIAPKKIVLHDQTLVRRLILDDTAVDRSSRRRRCTRIGPDEPIEYRAKTFVVASGYCWSSHLLLLSANARFPNGLANSSGLVGRYMNGHKFIQATANIDDQTFPGQNMTHSLISRQYLPLRDRQAVRPARHARVGELGRPRSAAARAGRQAAARRRADGRLAVAHQGQLGAAARLRRRASVSRQPAHARPVEQEPLRRSDAEDRASLRRGDAGAGSGDEGARAGRVRARSRRRATGASSTPAKGTTWITPAAAAGWAPIPRPASATATAAPTTTRTCSWSAPRRRRPAAARTARSRSSR